MKMLNRKFPDQRMPPPAAYHEARRADKRENNSMTQSHPLWIDLSQASAQSAVRGDRGNLINVA